MAKPWARYEVGFINHRKFLALNANAICLWLEGKNFADERHTDGLLPLAVVKHFRFYSKHSVDLLTRSAGPKDATSSEEFAPLWEPHPMGFKMHDYLDHNDCREAVIERMAAKKAAEAEKRVRDRERLREWRAHQREERRRRTEGPPAGIPERRQSERETQDETLPETLDETLAETGTETRFTAATKRVSSLRKQNTETERTIKARAFHDPEADDDTCRFIREVYPRVYAQVRNGAYFAVNEVRDFEVCDELVRTYGLERLTRMLELFLRMPQGRDVLNRPGTPRQLKHMAPTLDTELRKNGL